MAKQTEKRLRAVDETAAAEVDAPATGSVQRAQQLQRELAAAFPGRGSLSRAAVVALVAREHLLVLGPPGTGKSAFARALAEHVGESYYEVLLTKFSTPEEVFGPLSFSGLRADKYERLTASFLPCAGVAFIDEVFKASSAILNAMLSVMNERVFHNGSTPQPCPLQTMVAASNEYPQDKSLEALFDRFCFKFWVEYVDAPALAGLLRAGGPAPFSAHLEHGDLDALRAAAAAIPLTDANVDTILAVKAAIEADGFQASDRTWVKVPKLLRASAALRGATRIEACDFALLADALWKEHKDRARLATLIGNAADPYGSRAEAIVDGVRAAMHELPDLSLLKNGTKTKVEFLRAIADVSAKVGAEWGKVQDLTDEAKGADAVAQAVEVVEEAMMAIDELTSTASRYRA